MKKFPIQGKTLTLLAAIIPLLALFIFVVSRSGPLAPINVTAVKVQSRSIKPSLFGIGNIEARNTYKIGPIAAGRLESVNVDVGDSVIAGQAIAQIDPIDIDERLSSQSEIIKRSLVVVSDNKARKAFAQTQTSRYEQLLAVQATSEETVAIKRQELKIASAALNAAQADYSRAVADYATLASQKSNLRLVSPVNGIVSLRNAEPGSVVIAGQAVVEIIDPSSLWVNTRFDQIASKGLAPLLHASVALRSRGGEPIKGQVLRVELMADAITEEILAKIIFDEIVTPTLSIGELAQVTISLPETALLPVIPNAALRNNDGKNGVWKIAKNKLEFVPLTLGVSDLEGNVQVLNGLAAGEQIVVFSEKTLNAKSRFKIIDAIKGKKK